MSNEHEERDKIVKALGGKKGLLDLGLPTLVFLVGFNVSDQLKTATIAAILTAIILTIIRLAKRDTIQHVIPGFIAVLFSAYIANRSGNAADFYLPKLITNLVYGTVYSLANFAGWPILGLLLGPIVGENLTWRNHPERKRLYIRASWIWVAMFFSRIAVQYPIYRSGNVNLLGTVNLAMGYPLFIATAWASWLVIKRGPSAKSD